MKKKALMKVIGAILASVCIFSTMGFMTAVNFSAAAVDTQAAVEAQGDADQAIDLEPGIYPIDVYNYLIVHEDHTFEVVHYDPHKPAAPIFTPA